MAFNFFNTRGGKITVRVFEEDDNGHVYNAFELNQVSSVAYHVQAERGDMVETRLEVRAWGVTLLKGDNVKDLPPEIETETVASGERRIRFDDETV